MQRQSSHAGRGVEGLSHRDENRAGRLEIGLVDSAVIATAERLQIRRVLTVDERDFRAVRAKGGALTLLSRGR